MPQEILYEFDGFQLNPLRRRLLRDGDVISITPLASDLLTVFVKNHGQTLSKTELIGAVWPESVVTDNNFNVTLNAVRRALGETGRAPKYILKVSGGYCFVANVREISAAIDEKQNKELPETEWTAPNETAAQYAPSTHTAHVVLSSCLYGALYAVAVILEVAYEFDHYGRTALKIAPVVFAWMVICSIGGLKANHKLTSQGAKGGLALSTLVFLSAAAIVFIALTRFLPTRPITQSTLQSYPGQAAYLKDMSYFLVLAFCFLILPFNFIVSAQQEVQAGTAPTIYVRPWMLAALLLVLAGFSLALTSRLLDHLKAGPYTNLFTQLVYLRALLYFALGVECLVWYSRALNEVIAKRANAVSSG